MTLCKYRVEIVCLLLLNRLLLDCPRLQPMVVELRQGAQVHDPVRAARILARYLVEIGYSQNGPLLRFLDILIADAPEPFGEGNGHRDQRGDYRDVLRNRLTD